MPEFESGTVAIGQIFPYQNPVGRGRLENWIRQQGFDLIDSDAQQAINVGPQGMSVQGEEGIAKYDDLRLLFDDDANLAGFSNSSFITIKNINNVDFTSTIEQSYNLFNWLDEELDAAEDIVTFEVTIQGLIRTGRNYTISKYLSEDSFELLSDLGGHSGEGVTVRFESSAEEDTNDWYRLLLDEKAVGNPNIWGVKLVTRYDSIDAINEGDALGDLDEFIAHARRDTE